MINSSNDWKPIDGIDLEDKALEAIQSQDNVLVKAGPGSGKTELLAQKAIYLLQTNICQYPKKILALSFKKDAAANLAERISKRFGKDVDGRVYSRTYDSFCKSVLDQFRLALPNELQPSPNYTIVSEDKKFKDLSNKFGFINWQSLKSAVYQTPLDYERLSPKIKDIYRELLHSDDGISTLTFPLICLLAEVLIRTNPKIKASLQQTYEHVFLDEFQDTTSLQYEFIKQCFWHSNSKITAVGDDDQRIMGWAGAKKEIFDVFRNDFNAQLRILHLNHRSKPKLFDFQKRVQAFLHDQDYNSQTKFSKEDGELFLIKATDENQEAELIAGLIQQKLNNGLKPYQICILCRAKPEIHAQQIISCLKERNIWARDESKYQELMNEPVINVFLQTMDFCISNGRNPDLWSQMHDLAVKFGLINDLSIENSNYDEQVQKITTELNGIKEKLTQLDFGSALRSIISLWGESNLRGLSDSYKDPEYYKKIRDLFLQLLQEIPNNEADKNLSLILSKFKGRHSIPIMTIHKSKGLEFDSVFFVGLEDKLFWNYKNNSNEEKCAFFVALSRAKNSLFFSYCTNREGWQTTINTISDFHELLQHANVELLTNSTISDF